MIVQCETLKDFAEMCAAFVREGMHFRADTRTLRISLTGAH
jgi:hypothetical protein